MVGRHRRREGLCLRRRRRVARTSRRRPLVARNGHERRRRRGKPHHLRHGFKLHAPRNKPLPDLIPLSRWFRELASAARAYGETLRDCCTIAEALLADPRDPVVLHGDIHHSNILDFERHGWLAIDPKGLYGERGFDYANTFANEDLSTVTDPRRLRRQLPIVSRNAGIEPRRLLQWIAAYSGLSAAWFLDDGSLKAAESPLAVARIALAELEQA